MVRTLLILSLASAAALGAGQGVIMKQSTEDMKSGRKSVNTSYVEANRVAIETNDGARDMTMVYLADGNLIRMIDHSKKTVQEISGAELEKMMGQVNEAMAKMQEQMKNMPPQQRAMMEKMMGGRMKQAMGGVAEKPVYKRGDGSTQVGGHACDWYEGYRGDKMFAMLCAADWSEFDLRASDFAVFRKMADFLTKLAPGMADMARVGADDWQEQNMFPGVPVEQTIYLNGRPASKNTLEGVERGAIEDAVFQAPAGYKVRKGLPKQR